MKDRKNHRNGKSALTDSTIRRLNPKGDLNEKYGGWIPKKIDPNKNSEKNSRVGRGEGGMMPSTEPAQIVP